MSEARVYSRNDDYGHKIDMVELSDYGKLEKENKALTAERDRYKKSLEGIIWSIENGDFSAVEIYKLLQKALQGDKK